MKQGHEYQEKYTNEICIVESVHCTHVLVTFEKSGIKALINQKNYNKYTELEKE